MRVPALLLILLTAACAGQPAPLHEAASPARSPAKGITLSGAGEFTSSDTAAIAYNRKLAPRGAQASLTAESTGDQTRTSLVVEGLLPDRRYGAHLHTKPCGAQPDASGPHYQHHAGEASRASEVWLDFETDEEGTANSTARNDWALDASRLPASLVIHAKSTTPSGPEAGMAGDRIACLTVKKTP
ncbi:superoxide dismutase family protein [Nonomuraea sp. NPDC002799]